MEKLKQKDIKTRLLHLYKTIECGLHSGFSPCCVRYYVTVHLWRSESEMREYWKTVRDELGTIHPGYVVCPDCLTKRKFKEVQLCPVGSDCWHSDECAGQKRLKIKKVRLDLL
jgi:hypothetical protein